MEPGVTQALGTFVLLDSLVLAGWALARAALRTGLGIGCLGGLALLELVLLARAGAELVRLVLAPGGFGHGFAEPLVHLGYIAASVVTLPMLAAVAATGAVRTPDPEAPAPRATEPSPRPERRWDGVVAGVGCLAVAVVTVRMGSTGRAA
jgi:hypothetical protein